jgi:hypothetical protein
LIGHEAGAAAEDVRAHEAYRGSVRDAVERDDAVEQS